MNYVVMTDSRKSEAGGPPPTELPAPHGARRPQRAFDLWLNRGLHKLFDDVASEPVPDELLKLIEDDRERD
jgi:hypothetical protein